MARLKIKKRERAPISEREILVKLKWTSEVDLDLLALYLCKNGETGAVFSELYQGGTMGSVDEFPYIKLDRDAGFQAVGGRNEENLRIVKVDERIKEIYICVLNFTAASQGQTVSFSEYDAEVEVTAGQQNFFIPLNFTKKGHVAVIAKIENTIENTPKEGPKLENVSKAMTLEEFLAEVPGADILVD